VLSVSTLTRKGLLHAAPPAAGVLVFLLYRQVWTGARVRKIDPGIDPAALVDAADRFTAAAPVLGRLGWALTTLVFLLFWLAAVATCVLVIRDALRGRPRATANVLAGTGAAALLALWFSRGDNPLAAKLFQPIVLRAFEVLAIRGGERLLENTTGLVLAAAFAIAAAASCTLAEPGPGEDRTDHLAQQTARLNRALYVGTAALVAGILQVTAAHLLPASLLPEPEGERLRAVVHGLAAGLGTVWTLVLLAIYVPAAMELRRRARTVAAAELPQAGPAERRDWLAKRELGVTALQHATRVVAILGPFLAGGPLAPMMSLFG